MRVMFAVLVFSISVLALSFALPRAALAQNLDQKLARNISDEAASAFLENALRSIHKAQCDDGQLCAATTETELRSPPISIIDARAAMVFGIKSALAEWCGLDHKRSFLPMIAFGKDKMRLDTRQLQLMSLIHGDFMGRQLAVYTQSGQQCPAHFKAQLDGHLPKIPG